MIVPNNCPICNELWVIDPVLTRCENCKVQYFTPYDFVGYRPSISVDKKCIVQFEHKNVIFTWHLDDNILSVFEKYVEDSVSFEVSYFLPNFTNLNKLINRLNTILLYKK